MSNNSANTSRLAISALPLLNGTILQSSQCESTLRVSCTSSRLRLRTLIEAPAEEIVHLRNPNLRIQLPPRWPLPLPSALKLSSVPHRSAHNVLLSAIFFPAMIASLANSGVKRIA
jgi:hypothetical protein